MKKRLIYFLNIHSIFHKPLVNGQFNSTKILTKKPSARHQNCSWLCERVENLLSSTALNILHYEIEQNKKWNIDG